MLSKERLFRTMILFPPYPPLIHLDSDAHKKEHLIREQIVSRITDKSIFYGYKDLNTSMIVSTAVLAQTRFRKTRKK